MLLLPAFSQLERLHALAAHKLRDKGVLERVRSAANAVELYRAIRQERRGGAPTTWRPVPPGSALGCRGLCHQTRRIEQLALEYVKPVRLQMIENVLEIIDVPLRRKFQGVDGLQKDPLCMRCGPVGPTDKAKISLSLSSRNGWMIIDRPRRRPQRERWRFGSSRTAKAWRRAPRWWSLPLREQNPRAASPGLVAQCADQSSDRLAVEVRWQSRSPAIPAGRLSTGKQRRAWVSMGN
jgi:hypothetical protein